MTPLTDDAPQRSQDPRSLRARDAIRASIRDLLGERAECAAPSVTEVAAHAGVSRRAIYLNFGTLDDAMLETFMHLHDEAFPEHRDGDGPELLMWRIAHFVSANARFYHRVLTGPISYRAMSAVRDRFRNDTHRWVRPAAGPQDRTADFVLFGMLGCCIEASADPDLEPETLYAVLQQVMSAVGIPEA